MEEAYVEGFDSVGRANDPPYFHVVVRENNEFFPGAVPPSTVFASYNWFGGEAKIEVYPYNGHEGGGPYQVRREIEWLRTLVS